MTEKLAADDPDVGTVRDPNAVDPHAHLRLIAKASDGGDGGPATETEEADAADATTDDLTGEL